MISGIGAILRNWAIASLSIAWIAGGLLLSACGGGAGPASRAGGAQAGASGEKGSLVRTGKAIAEANPPLSKARLVTRVNWICRRSWPRTRRSLRRYASRLASEQGGPARFESMVVHSLLPDIEARIFNRILALGAPREGQGKLRAIMRWLGEAIEIGERDFPMTSPRAVWDLFDIYDPLARRYGIGECAVNAAHTGLGTSPK